MDSQLFEQVDSYKYSDDAEFRLGLASILQHAQSKEQSDELELKARCFYYARKTGTSVDYNAYRDWKELNTKGKGTDSATATVESTTTSSSNPPSMEDQIASTNVVESASAGDPNDKPAFTYQEIVDMIQSGKPIPGIKDVPDTILEGQGTESTKSKRRKPWEKQDIERSNEVTV